MPTVAIGDIHGHLSALEDLLEKVLPTLSSSDVLVFLGDYIDKGPDVRGCVDRVISVREAAPCTVVALLGNHEQWMLRSWKDPTSHSWIWMGGLETISSYSPEAARSIRNELETAGTRLVLDKVPVGYDMFFDLMPAKHLAFFRELELYCETEDAVCVHVGVALQGGPTHLMDLEVLVWGENGFPEGYKGERAVVYGHWDNSIEDDSGLPFTAHLKQSDLRHRYDSQRSEQEAVVKPKTIPGWNPLPGANLSRCRSRLLRLARRCSGSCWPLPYYTASTAGAGFLLANSRRP